VRQPAPAGLYPARIETTREELRARFRDGQIVHTRDYSDPIAGARALGRVPQLLAALTGSQPG
jgi:hypothetical protein